MSQDKVESQDNELGADSPASKPLKKTRRTYTAESVALDHGVTVEQVLEANGNPKKTKGSHFVNKGKVDGILNAAKLAESEAKAEDDKAEPGIKTQLSAEFFEGEPAPPSNDAWAEQEAGDSHTSIEVEASTMAARLRIKLKQLLKLFGIEFDPGNDEANGLKKVDEAEAERLFQEACEYAAAVEAEAKAEARAKAEADAEAAAEAKAEADAEAKAEAQSVEVETEEEVEASAEAETEVEVEAKDEQTPVPYIVSSTQVDEPEETPKKETAPEGIFDFSDEFTQSYIDRAQAFIKLIECEA